MPTLEKDVIRPGVYMPADGEPRKVTAEEIRLWTENHQKLTAKGYKVPIFMSHPGQDERHAWPMKDEQLKEIQDSPWYIGTVKGYKIGDDGTLVVQYDDDDEKRAKRLTTKNARVSPQFGPWTDDEKQRWDGVISHISVVKKPVNPNQSDRFKNVTETTLAFGLPDKVCVFGLDDAVPVDKIPETWQMGLDDKLAKKKKSAPSMPDGNKPPVAGNPKPPGLDPTANDQDGDGFDDESENDDDQDQDGMEDGEEDEEGQEQTLTLGKDVPAKAVELISSLLSSLPPDKLIDALSGLLQSIKTNGSDGKDGETDDPNNLESAPVTVQMGENDMADTPPKAPAADDKNKELATQVQQFGLENTRLKAQVSRFLQNDFARTKAGIESDLATLQGDGRITKADADKLRDEMKTVQFSDDESHAAPLDKISQKVSWHKELPKGAFWSDEQKVQQFGAEVHDVSRDAFFAPERGNELSAAEVEESCKVFQSGDYGKLDTIGAK